MTNNYKNISKSESNISNLVSRYPTGSINIKDLYGTVFTDRNTTISNNAKVTKNFLTGKCVNKISSKFPTQNYNITNPDGTKTFEYFSNNIDNNNKNNYNILFLILFFILFLILYKFK